MQLQYKKILSTAQNRATIRIRIVLLVIWKIIQLHFLSELARNFIVFLR